MNVRECASWSLWLSAAASIIGSVFCFGAGLCDLALFIGMWPSVILLVYVILRQNGYL